MKGLKILMTVHLMVPELLDRTGKYLNLLCFNIYIFFKLVEAVLSHLN
jgi:hypothetical protein